MIFSLLNISKHAQVEVMDWKFYVAKKELLKQSLLLFIIFNIISFSQENTSRSIIGNIP